MPGKTRRHLVVLAMAEALQGHTMETTTWAYCCWVFLQVVESGGKNVEVAVMTRDKGLRLLKEEEVEEIVKKIEEEKAAAEAAKKASRGERTQT